VSTYRRNNGPDRQLTTIFIYRTFFDDCHKNGYKFALGGDTNNSKKGYFLPISIVDNPPESSKIVQEERKLGCNSFYNSHAEFNFHVAFGPIAPLIKWSTDDDVVRRASK
jgi:hypothetical protein